MSKVRRALTGVLVGTALLGTVGTAVAEKTHAPLTLRTLQGKEIKAKYEKEIKTPDGTIKVYSLKEETPAFDKKIYLWRIGNFVFVNGFKIDKEGHLTPLKSSTVERKVLSKDYLNSLNALVEKFEKAGIKYEGHGKPIYVFIDSFCPFCMKKMKEKYPEFVKKHKVILLPFAVHGANSINSLACIYEESAKKGIPVAEVFKEKFSKFNGSWQEYARQYANCKPNSKWLNLIGESTRFAVTHGATGTPAIVYPTKEGYKLFMGKVTEK